VARKALPTAEMAVAPVTNIALTDTRQISRSVETMIALLINLGNGKLCRRAQEAVEAG
jgi:hypothetical protein